MWQLRDVKVNGRGLKPPLHPDAGPLDIEFEVFNPMGAPDLGLVVYRATDAASQSTLDEITRSARRSLRAI